MRALISGKQSTNVAKAGRKRLVNAMRKIKNRRCEFFAVHWQKRNETRRPTKLPVTSSVIETCLFFSEPIPRCQFREAGVE